MSHRTIPMDRPYMNWLDVRTALYYQRHTPDVWSIKAKNTANTYEFTHI